MIFHESETVELKEIVVDDIKKEIIAFANCEGGKLYIGVQDDGTVIDVNAFRSQAFLGYIIGSFRASLHINQYYMLSIL